MVFWDTIGVVKENRQVGIIGLYHTFTIRLSEVFYLYAVVEGKPQKVAHYCEPHWEIKQKADEENKQHNRARNLELFVRLIRCCKLPIDTKARQEVNQHSGKKRIGGVGVNFR